MTDIRMQFRIVRWLGIMTVIIGSHLLILPSGWARTWALKESRKTIDAKFLSLDRGLVRLRHYTDNQVYRYPITDLTETDQDYIINQILAKKRVVRTNFQRIKANFDGAVIEAGLLPAASEKDLIRQTIKILDVTDDNELLALDEQGEMIGVRMNTADIHRRDRLAILGYLEDSINYENQQGEKKAMKVYMAIPDLTEADFRHQLKNHFFLQQLVYYHEPLYEVIK